MPKAARNIATKLREESGYRPEGKRSKAAPAGPITSGLSSGNVHYAERATPGRMADRWLLNRRTGLNRYRGFESPLSASSELQTPGIAGGGALRRCGTQMVTGRLLAHDALLRRRVVGIGNARLDGVIDPLARQAGLGGPLVQFGDLPGYEIVEFLPRDRGAVAAGFAPSGFDRAGVVAASLCRKSSRGGRFLAGASR